MLSNLFFWLVWAQMQRRRKLQSSRSVREKLYRRPQVIELERRELLAGSIVGPPLATPGADFEFSGHGWPAETRVYWDISVAGESVRHGSERTDEIGSFHKDPYLFRSTPLGSAIATAWTKVDPTDIAIHDFLIQAEPHSEMAIPTTSAETTVSVITNSENVVINQDSGSGSISIQVSSSSAINDNSSANRTVSTALAFRSIEVSGEFRAGGKIRLTGDGYEKWQDVQFHLSQGDKEIFLEDDRANSRGQVRTFRVKVPAEIWGLQEGLALLVAKDKTTEEVLQTKMVQIGEQFNYMPIVTQFVSLVEFPDTQPAPYPEATSAVEESMFVRQLVGGQAPNPDYPNTVLSDANKPGALEVKSYSERSVIPAEGDPIHFSYFYFDHRYGVGVHSPAGKHFGIWPNGRVELVDGPLPKAAPTQTHGFFVQDPEGYRPESVIVSAAKPVARTGLTFFDNPRGIDVHARAGHYLIEFEDGTIEERALHPGNIVPYPSQFTIGGPDNSKPKSAFGPSLEELGLVVSRASTPKPTSELILIGDRYTAENGVVHQAPPYKVFVQDLGSKTILLRPKSEAAQAQVRVNGAGQQEPHDTETIKDLFQQAYARAPTEQELTYWRLRTDKYGPALLGAMEFANARARTTSGEVHWADSNEFPILFSDEAIVLNSGDGTVSGALVNTYADAIRIGQSLQEASNDTLVIIFYGSNQKRGESDGISKLAHSLKNQLAHVIELETGWNPNYVRSNPSDVIFSNGLNTYGWHLNDNLATIRPLLTDGSITNLALFGYSWGANMAYDVSNALLTEFPYLRLLTTVYVDGISVIGPSALTLYNSNSASLLNIYQSIGNEITTGSELVWYKHLDYQPFQHFSNPLGRMLEVNMDQMQSGVDHLNIDDNSLVISMAERFIIGAIKQVHELR